MSLASLSYIASLLQVPVQSAQPHAVTPAELRSIQSAVRKPRYDLFDQCRRAPRYRYFRFIVHP
jgi:hypothetical protein